MAFSDVPVWKRGSPLEPKRHVDITPSDSTTYSPPLNGLLCTVSGNVAVLLSGDTAAVTWVCTAGITYPGSIQKVMSTNTTGTVKGLYLT
jgi:hypothetical protein